MKIISSYLQPALLCLCLGTVEFRAHAAEVITGFDPTTGQIATVSMNGNVKASFVPQNCYCGRGLAFVKNGQFGRVLYYTVILKNQAGIHIAPYNGGQGGADITTFPNPDTRSGAYIQDLDVVGNSLYVMTGYPSSSLKVFRLNRNTGAPIGAPVAIQTSPSNNADGFVVLPNGNFLINQADASNIYCEYNFSSGAPVSCPAITLTADLSTGVDYNPYDHLLYFATAKDDLSGGTIVATDLAGTVKKTIPMPQFFEDIDVHKGP